MYDNQIIGLIRNVIKEEIANMARTTNADHEASMARAELRDMIKNGSEVYKQIQVGQELPGWVSAYITLASDYMHSVYEWMAEQQHN
jgi:hypothetical protein